MKKLLLPLYVGIAVSACAFAETTDYNLPGGISGSRVTIPGGDYNMILNPNAGTPTQAYFIGNSNAGFAPTVTTLSTTGSPTLWDIAYWLNVDIKAATGTVNAFHNNGSMQWRIGGVTIKNSVAGDAVANVEIGSLKLVVNNTSNETCKLNIATNAAVTGTSLDATMSSTGLQISNNATVDYSVANTNLLSSTFVNIDSGSTLNASGKFTFSTQSTINVNGTFNYLGTASFTTGKLIVNGGKLTANNVQSSVPVNSKIVIGAASSVSNGGQIELTGALQLASGGSFTVEDSAGSILLKDADTTYTGRIIMNGGTLTVNKADAFARDNASNHYANLVLLGTGGVVNVNAANRFAALHFSPGSSVIFNLSANAEDVVMFSAITGQQSGASWTINDFADNRIFFVSATELLSDFGITANGADGNVYTVDDLEFVAGNYNGTNGYWLNVAVVPEPADFAAILGALAITFALKRRFNKK